MSDERVMTRWQEIGDRVFREMAAWQQEHAHATFAEIEAAVEDRLGTLRAELIEDAVATRARADDRGSEGTKCPHCGHRMESRGLRERVVTVRGNQLVRVRRRNLVCPACQAGVFPPG